jgi:hypothetical protein
MGEALSTATSEEGGYRPVSGPAVAAMVAGVLSAAALVNPFFWVVPLLGIGLACLGLADTGRPGAEKAGRTLALTGLALAVGFGTQAVSAAAAQRWIVRSRAQAAAGLWVTAVRDGRHDDARSMCLPEAVPQIDTIAARIGGCAGEPTLSAISSPADEASGGRSVRAAFASCGIAFDIHLVPTDVVRQEGTVERWMVAKCEPSVEE